MSKHTPGPWWVDEVFDEDGGLIARGIRSNSGGLNRGNEYEFFDLEDARLIAAAPEMLQALKDARDTIQHWGDYAEEYFQKKHDLAGDLAAIDNLIARIESS